jgi:hypothetical protein
MKREKTRLADLASKMRLSEKRLPEIGKTDFGNRTIDPNPPHGEKGDFRKISVTLPPVAYEKLVQESARRKIAGEPNHLLSAIIREAVLGYLGERSDRAGE